MPPPRSRTRSTPIRGSLPEGILEPRVTKDEMAGGFLAHLRGRGRRHDDRAAQLVHRRCVSKRLLGVEGMAEVYRFGGVDREIEVMLDLGRMQALWRDRQPDQPGAALDQCRCRGRDGRGRRNAPVGPRAGQQRERLRAVAAPDPAGQWRHRQAGRRRHRARRLSRAHLDQQGARQGSRQFRHVARQAAHRM